MRAAGASMGLPSARVSGVVRQHADRLSGLFPATTAGPRPQYTTTSVPGHPSRTLLASNMRVQDSPSVRTRFHNERALDVRMEQSSAAAAGVYASTQARRAVHAAGISAAVGLYGSGRGDVLSDSSDTDVSGVGEREGEWCVLQLDVRFESLALGYSLAVGDNAVGLAMGMGVEWRGRGVVTVDEHAYRC